MPISLAGKLPLPAADLQRDPNGIPECGLVLRAQACNPRSHGGVKAVVPASMHPLLQPGFQVLRRPRCAGGDGSELILVALVCRLVLARREQCTDNGEGIDLDHFDAKAAPQLRKEFEAEEHPGFVGIRKCRSTSARAQMTKALLPYTGPIGRCRRSEGQQSDMSELALRSAWSGERRCRRSINGDPLHAPIHFVQDATDCVHDTASRFSEWRRQSDPPIDNPSWNGGAQVLW